MFSLSSSIINDIIEALIPTWEPAFNGPQITYTAAKCGGCTGSCKGTCNQTCKSGCKTTCKGGCRATLKGRKR